MNPFDQPPAGTPISFEPPEPPAAGPGRGRMALVALVTVGLVGAGIAGLSQLASADQPELAVSATEEPTDDTLPPVDDDASDDEPDDEPEPVVETEGQIVVETEDGDPIVIDLGDLAGTDFGGLAECIGLPMFDFDFDFNIDDFEEGDHPEFPIGDLEDLFDDLPFDLDDFEDFDFEDFDFDSEEFGAFDIDGSSVTVAGPDGVSVIDLGESGSVTITKENGEVTIATEGDATVDELSDLFGEFGTIFGGEFDFGDFDLGEFGIDDQMIEDFLESAPTADGESLPTLDEFSEFMPIDPDEVQACLDEMIDG